MHGRAGGSEPVAFWIPGRIEVLGKHTDYGGGRSLLCAVERGICLLARAREETSPMPPRAPLVRVRDARIGETALVELSPNVSSAPGHWSNYPITVARRIAMNFSGPLRGADIAFESDLPPAAGVSSSSALVVAIFLALSAVNDLPARAEYRHNIHSLEDLAGYLGAVENGLDFKSLACTAGVGTFGGSEDHTAILCARPGSLVQYSFCPVTFERAIALPVDYCFVIAASGVLAEKTGAALSDYNQVSRRLGAGLEYWRRATGRTDVSMGAAVASSDDARQRIRGVLAGASDAEYPPVSLLARFDQFDAETNDIIPAATSALARDDLGGFGALVSRSQAGAERGLNNQIPQTIALVRRALELGAAAASAFGAGFGGSVWALVESRRAQAFLSAWGSAYSVAFPESASVAQLFVTGAGPAATQL
ncbi:MAG TPA: galactokinase family protein [Gemmatimonadaceae bacterium]